MDESAFPRREAAAVRPTQTKQRLNQSTTDSLVKMLIGRGDLDAIRSQRGDYFTKPALHKEILNGIDSWGGRTTIHDLQTILSVDIGDIEVAVRAMVSDGGSAGAIRVVGGELISKKYLKSLLGTDISRYIDEEGITTIGSIAKQFSLPMDLAGSLVRDGIDAGILDATVKGSSIVTKKHDDKLEHRVKGACSGCTKAIGLGTITKLLGSSVSESEIAAALKRLIARGAVDGQVKGMAFVPAVYVRLQISCLEDFYRENGYVEYSRARKLKVTNEVQVIESTFPNAIPLRTCAVNPGQVLPFLTELQELVSTCESVPPAAPVWPQGLAFLHAPSLLPVFLQQEDVAMLLEMYSTGNCFEGSDANGGGVAVHPGISTLSSNVVVLSGLYVSTTFFVSRIVDLFGEDSCQVGEIIASLYVSDDNAKSILMTSTSDKYSDAMLEKFEELKILSDAVCVPTSRPQICPEGFVTDVASGTSVNDKTFGTVPSSDYFVYPEDASAINSATKTMEMLSKSGVRSKDISGHHITDIVSPFYNCDRRACMLARFLSNEHPGAKESDLAEKDARLFTEGLWDYVADKCVARYAYEAKLSIEKAMKCDFNGNIENNLEDTRNSCFTSMWAQLQIVTKGLGILEARKIESYRPTKSPCPQRIHGLHTFVLRTRCVYISVLLTMHASWGVSEEPLLNFRDSGGCFCLSDEHRRYIRKYIPRDKALVLLKLWDICLNSESARTVWDFMDVVVSDASPTFNLIAATGSKSTSQWTLDRKKDRIVTAEMKQRRTQGVLSFVSALTETADDAYPAVNARELTVAVGSLASLCLNSASLVPGFNLNDGTISAIQSGNVLIDFPYEDLSSSKEVLRRVIEGLIRPESTNEKSCQTKTLNILHSARSLFNYLDFGQKNANVGGSYSVRDLNDLLSSCEAVLLHS